MSDKMAFILFGDQSSDTQGFFADFCRRGNPSILAQAFLDQACTSLKHEIDRLPALKRQRFPIFSNIQELNQRYHQQDVKNSAIDSALLVTIQLAHYIDRAEKVPEDATRPWETCSVGLCTGLFAAVAVSIAPSLSVLVTIGVEFVMLAFRTGAHVASFADGLYQIGEVSESWTHVIPGVSESSAKNLLEHFNESKGFTSASRAYISAVTSSSIAISGPPSTLNALFTEHEFNAKPMPLPVYGPYHAAHLYATTDVEKMLRLDDTRLSALLQKYAPRFPVMSCSAGKWFEEKETISLIRAVMRDILISPLQFHRVLGGCIVRAQNCRGPKCLVMPFGPTHAASSLATMLKNQTDLEVLLRKAPHARKDRIAGYTGDHGSSQRGKLAIVGMAGRFPDAATHEKLWELLEQGLDVHREVPADRFDVKTHVDVTGKAMNTSHTPYGCWIENPGLFDPRFFNMSPREAFQTDPMQRMALTTAYEALEMSGYVPNRTRSTKLDRISTFYGQTSDDWREINAAQEVDTYFITGGVRAFGPGRINYHFGFSGPSFSIDTACSSSMAAMQLACTSLWAKDCDTAIVGGLSCMTNSDIFAGLSRGQFLSKNGPCATFDNDADGYCRADACGTVIVKRLEDAEADKDNILAVILGTATNHSADAVSITHPHGGTQELLYKDILNMAGVDPLDVDYVEMHGTGTQAGDATEMKSVTNVFAPAERKRKSHQSLYLGSVKANVGHGEAASGITAIIKSLMMLQKNAIPPHVGIKKTINRTFPKDLAERNVHIAFHTTPFLGKPGQPRRLYISNFSAAGGNSGLLLEDGPSRIASSFDARTNHVVSISGKSKSAMIKNAERLIVYLEAHPETSLADLSYTTTARRIQHNWRIMITASEISQVKEDIKLKLTENITPIPTEAPKAAFVFTGQGSHYAGLGKDLLENSTVFRDSILEFNNLALIHGLPSFLSLMDGSISDVQSLSPIVVQLGLLCFEMATARLWASWGVTPSVVLGHSLGEYAALHVAGVLSASDAIYLVGMRAQLLLEKCTVGTHVMLAVQGSVQAVLDSLRGIEMSPNIACINGPRETVLSGEASEMSAAAENLNTAGFKCTQLKVPFAFHSAQVDPILETFESFASRVTFKKPNIPVISPLLGRVLKEGDAIDPSYLRRHARDSVDFLAGLVAAQSDGIIDEKTLFLEVGPHPVCISMVKATLGATTISVPTLRRNEVAYKTVSASVSVLHTVGLDIDWNEYHRDFNESLTLLALPTYAFDEKNYWLQYSGDWCLTKNRVTKSAPVELLEDVKPKLATTTIHRVTEESVSGDVVTVSTESDLARPDLRAAVMGHLVNGAGLCPSSIYADMAMTVCDYAYKLLRPDAEQVGMNVASMEVVKPVIGKPDGSSQILKLTAKLDFASGRADLTYSTGSDKSYVKHATCHVEFGDNGSWLQEWQKNTYLIQSRIDWLKDAEKSGKASKIGRGIAYKLFQALVDYDSKYRGMEEVILYSDNMEATSRVKFQTSEKDGNFHCSPYWIDSVAHISGFIVNGTDAVDSRNQVYISHGWESLRIAEPLTIEKSYRSYVRMQSAGGKVVAGDVYVFDGDRIVAVVGGLKFQCIPRSILNTFLPPIGVSSPAVKTPTSAAKPFSSAAKPFVPIQTSGSMTSLRTKRTKTVETAQVSLSNIHSVNQKLSSITSQALDILAKEIGVGNDELVDNIAFADLGVDSLMSLTVSGRMREELEVDIHSEMFLEHPTIGLFKKYLARFERRESASSESTVSEIMTDQSTPELDDSSPISTPDDSPSEAGKDESISDIIRTTIADEMGVEVQEVIEAHDLASLGMDSLMSLSILGNLREKTGLSLPADLFITSPSLKEIEYALNIQPVIKETTVVSVKERQVKIITPERQATSVLLQGRPRTATKQLFMIPDGGGSATSYTDLSEISPDVAVWGLNSPFMKVPEEYDCGVKGMAEKFIVEMKRRQPQGPYSVAGWSAGGVISFEIVNQLIKNGDVVDHLILIDAPCPLTIEPLPSSLHRWFASIGLLGDGDPSKLPAWLLPHFAASVTALSNYTAEVIEPTRAPIVTAIWCEDGVCKLPSDPRPDPYPYGHAQFLLENRTDFGPNLWDTYLPSDKIVTKHMPGNHFSMMGGDLAKTLGNLIREAVQTRV